MAFFTKLSTYSFLQTKPIKFSCYCNVRIREKAQSCAFDELEYMTYVPCRKMVVWTIVWCPHRFTHEKTHCLFEPELLIF